MNSPNSSKDWTTALTAELPRLVRLCRLLLGDANAAEDAAQETLIEAWRNAYKLRDLEGIVPWLNAIARNVCARSARRRAREWARITTEPASDGSAALLWETAPGVSVDIEVELERAELVQLLDRALALLSTETRTILLSHFVAETPYAEIAIQLGMTEGAVAVRVHRGKVALRHLLEQEYAVEAATFGAPIPVANGWQLTRIWCPFCGAEKLEALIDHVQGFANFRCPRCLQITGTRRTGLFNGLKNPKAILSRQIEWLNTHYRAAITDGTVPCINCGTPTTAVPVTHKVYPQYFDPYSHYAIHIICRGCRLFDMNGLRYLALDLPATQRFWREHPRMRVRPERTIERNNRPTLVTTFESVTDAQTLDLLSDANTLEVVALYRNDSEV